MVADLACVRMGATLFPGSGRTIGSLDGENRQSASAVEWFDVRSREEERKEVGWLSVKHSGQNEKGALTERCAALSKLTA
jgi:hypothetical protein